MSDDEATIERLFQAARRFREWCRELPPGDGESMRELHRGAVLLARLYAEALQVRRPAEFDPDIDARHQRKEEWDRALRAAGRLPFDEYALIFDPHDLSETPCVGSLADDIADIDRNLGEALDLLERGHRAEAQWQIVFDFQSHWGRHAASALHAIHVKLAEEFL